MRCPPTLVILACITAVSFPAYSKVSGPALTANFLLGSWHRTAGASGCNQKMIFSARHQDITWRGSTSGAPVSGYVVSGDTIIVGGTPGVVETFSYKVVNANTIAQPQMAGGCVWSRG